MRRKTLLCLILGLGLGYPALLARLLLVRFARFVAAVAGSHARFNDADSPMLAIPRLSPDDDFHVLAERGE
jgi:hypothetical protein